MRVALIPTGRLELAALDKSLERLFPGHEFYTIPLRPGDPPEPFDSFTSSRLGGVKSTAPSNLSKLVERLSAEVVPGRGGRPADLVVLLDDLELENTDQPGVVVSAVRDAVRTHISAVGRERPSLASRLEETLRQRASFHLSVPMIEAWFFADQAALSAAGIPKERLPPKRKPGDLELFETDDPDYIADDGSACVELLRRNRQKQRPERPPWQVRDRERHPKAYISWLCKDPSQRKCSSYKESAGGADALQSLDWNSVLADPAACLFARSLILDLAEGLGQPPRGCSLEGQESPLTSRSHLPPDPVLRNL